MAISEYRKRMNQLRKLLQNQEMEGLVIKGVEDIRYLSGFCGHDSWLLVLPRSVVLITDSRYTEQACSECVGCEIVERKGGLIKEAASLITKTKGISVVGIEDTCSVSLLKGLRKELSVKVKPIRPVVEKIRMIKAPDEVNLIRRASKIAFNSMEWALEQLRPGMTELELSALYEYRLSHFQAQKGFDTIVCFGANGSRNHHQPGKRKLRKNDTILLDFGANYKGYISDTTRCFAYGKMTKYFKQVYQTVALAQKAAVKTVKAGAKLSEVDAAARQVIEASGLPVYGHGTGHGLGMQVHEPPYLSRTDKKGILEAGQVVTIEPGIYLPGKLGVRLEDDVLVTDSGCLILSRDKRFDIKTEDVPLLS